MRRCLFKVALVAGGVILWQSNAVLRAERWPDPEIWLSVVEPPPTPAQACASHDYQARLTGCSQLLAETALSPQARASAQYAHATARLVENDFEGALRDLDAVLALQPDFAEALAARASILLRHKRLARALADLDRSLTLAPELAATWALRGHAHLAAGMLDEAAQDFGSALARARHLASAHYGMGLVHMQRQQAKAAIAAFTRTLAIDHQHAEAYLNRGVVHVPLKNWRQARADFDYAILSRPNYLGAHFQRARLHHQQKRYAQAIDDYTTVLQYDSSFVPALENRGRAWILRGEPVKAAQDLVRAAGLAPGNAQIEALISSIRQGGASSDRRDWADTMPY